MNSFVSSGVGGQSGGIRLLDNLVVLVCLILIPSAIAHTFMGLQEKVVFAVLAPIVLFASLISSRRSVHPTIPGFIVALTLVGSLASIFSMRMSQLLMSMTLAIAVVVGRQLYLTLGRTKVLRVVTWFTLMLLVGGVVGILYVMFGGQPLMAVQVGYRTTHLYLTTFSFAFIGTIIRPSGIFDEPGSLAMYAAIVTMFNDTLRQNQKLNLAIISLLVFTGSLAGLVISALYLVSSNAMRSTKKSLVILAALLVGYFSLSVAVPSNPISKIVETFYSDRLKLEDGRLVGDNRSNQVFEFFSLVDFDMLRHGSKYFNDRYDEEDQSSNPFSIVYGYGLIISIPYFSLIVWLLMIAIRQGFSNSYTSIGLVALLLQRPYIYNMSWSILIASAVWLVYHSSRNRRHYTVHHTRKRLSMMEPKMPEQRLF